MFQVIQLIYTPNLNGNWQGEYVSSHIDEKTGECYKGNTELTIKQSWTRIRIISENGKSVSCSEVAGLAINDNMGLVLRFQYRNEAKFDSADSMSCHSGFNKLRYYEDGRIEGDYFTDRNRRTYGTLKYKKKVNE